MGTDAQDQATTEVRDNAGAERYELTRDGDLAGTIMYRRRPGLLALVHTEVDERFEGLGLGSVLVRGALDDARSRGLVVLPFCPFVNGYIQRHREYTDLVPEAYREEFGLA